MVVSSPASRPGEASHHVRQITANTRCEEGRSVIAQGEARREACEPGFPSVHQATQGRVRLTNGAGSSPRGARGTTSITPRRRSVSPPPAPSLQHVAEVLRRPARGVPSPEVAVHHSAPEVVQLRRHHMPAGPPRERVDEPRQPTFRSIRRRRDVQVLIRPRLGGGLAIRHDQQHRRRLRMPPETPLQAEACAAGWAASSSPLLARVPVAVPIEAVDVTPDHSRHPVQVGRSVPATPCAIDVARLRYAGVGIIRVTP